MTEAELEVLRQQTELAASKGETLVIAPGVLLALFEEVDEAQDEVEDAVQSVEMLQGEVDAKNQEIVDLETELRHFQDIVEGLNDS
jgi:uncharacterized protein YqhQ